MGLTKLEIAITKDALKEKIYLLNKDLNAYYYDLNHDQTALTENCIKLFSIFNRNYDLEKEYNHKIKSIEILKNRIAKIEKIITKLETQNGIKSSR